MTYRGVHRLAVVTTLVTYLLLTVGGVVTSRDAGLVFPDWPRSNGSFNPEGWTTDADKGSEHGHRILGALVGMLSIALAVGLHRREKRLWVRRLGWIALGAVCVQGLLGGLRVTESSTELALVHGCFGQAVFCIMVALAYLTSRSAAEVPEAGSDTGRLATAAAACCFTIFMQVVLGAHLRHVSGPLQSHLLGAALVAITVTWLLTITLIGHAERPSLRRPALLLGLLLLVQIALGLSTAAVLKGLSPRDLSTAQVVLPTLHQSVGALMLATSLVLALAAFRRRHPAPDAREVPA